VFIKFDTANGTIQFGQLAIVKADMTASELQAIGVRFTHDFDMKTGWILRKAAPLLLDGESVNWSFSFKSEKLQSLSFAISAEADQDLNVLREKHDSFLSKELGPPDEKGAHYTIYRYPWGEISSGVDVRNGSSQIVARWT
jgi:hypothetical protein